MERQNLRLELIKSGIRKQGYFKGQCHEIFLVGFLHQSAAYGPFRGTLGALHTLKNFHVDIPLKLTPRWYKHREVNQKGFLKFFQNLDSPVLLSPGSQLYVTRTPQKLVKI